MGKKLDAAIVNLNDAIEVRERSTVRPTNPYDLGHTEGFTAGLRAALTILRKTAPSPWTVARYFDITVE